MTTTALDETSSLAALSNAISFLSQLYYTKPGFLFPLSSTSTRPQDLNINAFFLLMCMCFGPWDCPLQSSKERIKVVDHHQTVLPNVNWKTKRKVQSIDQEKKENGLKPKMKESMLKYLDSGAELTVLHIKKAIVAQVKSNSQLISKNDEPTPF